MSRRDFLKTSLQTAGVAAGLAMSTRSGLLHAASTRADTHRRRLVLIELAGANDGLNTLVPYTNDHYYALRPTLAIAAQQVITLDNHVGIHPELSPLMPLWDNGDIAWVQGLGYPKPNRSHFKSIRLWETGSDGNHERGDGWLTHTMEHALHRVVTDAHGISLKGSMGLFSSDGGRWLSMDSPSQFEQALLSDNTLPDQPVQFANPSLAAVARNQQDLNSALTSIRQRLNRTPSSKSITNSQLGQQLSHVLRLINAGVDTPVYRVQHTGFDTHENQAGRHARLLNNLATAVAAFRTELVAMGEWNNTVVMTYSEFGRRVAENRSFGTDHGTAAPHFVAGGHVNGGIYGVQPNLAALINGDLSHTLDYRALYQAVLSRWFQAAENPFKQQRDRAVSRLFS